jgi:hypothetical protein
VGSLDQIARRMMGPRRSFDDLVDDLAIQVPLNRAIVLRRWCGYTHATRS